MSDHHDGVILSYRDERLNDLGRVMKTFGCDRSSAELYLLLERRANAIRPYDVIAAEADDMFGRDMKLTTGAIHTRRRRLQSALDAFQERTGVEITIITHSGLGLELVLPKNLLRRSAPPDKPLEEWTVDEVIRSNMAIIAGVVSGEIILAPEQRYLAVHSGRIGVTYLSEAEAEGGDQ